jgi:hypothetical protein
LNLFVYQTSAPTSSWQNWIVMLGGVLCGANEADIIVTDLVHDDAMIETARRNNDDLLVVTSHWLAEVVALRETITVDKMRELAGDHLVFSPEKKESV